MEAASELMGVGAAFEAGVQTAMTEDVKVNKVSLAPTHWCLMIGSKSIIVRMYT